MFGEYMVYVNDKPLLLACDNTVFVKILPELSELMVGAETALPYEGGKPHYILDIEDRALTLEAVAILEPITPLPRLEKSCDMMDGSEFITHLTGKGAVAACAFADRIVHESRECDCWYLFFDETAMDTTLTSARYIISAGSAVLRTAARARTFPVSGLAK